MALDGVTKRFGGLVAVKGASFSVEAERITSLIGPNGAGKTTVLNMICGLIRPSEGQILFRGRPITELRPFQIARLGVGRTFQEPRVFPHMTVLDNVRIGARSARDENLIRVALGIPGGAAERKEILDRARDLLDFVGLTASAHRLASQLSYGQQRFLSIARVLAGEPDVLLMDEPTMGIQPKDVERQATLLQEMVSHRNKTVLLVEHNMDVVMGVSHRIHLLVEGEVMASGPPAEMRGNHVLIESYLGRGVAGLAREVASGEAVPRAARSG
jgi:branched-chain amino acid transport system ATP-binding protein